MHGGQVRHALSDPANVAAVCGMEPWTHRRWYGAGSRAECELVADLPACKKCLAKVGG
jgi:hypothetical protein